MRGLFKILVFLAAVFAALPAMAQTSTGLMISPQTNEILPPAPSSAQQIRYQSPQPALATGAVNLSIPLYTIEAEGLSIPFTLSYRTSGIKPLDDPYPCGYGWSMLPALKIVRTIRGRADEKFDYWGDKLFPYEGFSVPKYLYASMASICSLEATFNDEFTDRYDTEKDIFTISLPSGVYNRIYQKEDDGTISFLGGGSDDEIKVTADDGLHNFYVRDAQGFVYHFGEKGTNGGGCAEILNDGSNRTVAVTGWGIVDISLPSGRKVDFKWTSYVPADKKILGGDIYCDDFDALPGTQFNQNESERIKNETLKGCPQSANGNYSYRIALSSVSFPGGTVSLSYKNRMTDSFTVVSSASDTIRTVSMRYGPGNVECLFLKEVEISGEGTYRFEYDPQRFEGEFGRYRQDWWGYYNGVRSATPKTLSPRLKINAQYNSFYGGNTIVCTVGHANRSIDEQAMQAGILKKIVYPTGGYSTFEYETHSFPATKADSHGIIISETDPALDKGGGLRVKKICTYSRDEDQRPHIRNYQYDSVEVTAVPSAATFITVNRAVGMCTTQFGEAKARFYRQIFVNTASDYMQNHIGEDAIWYRQVTEVYDEGKAVHRFDYPVPPSIETRKLGNLCPDSMFNIFTHGAVPVSKEIYKKEGQTYTKVETTTYGYEIIDNGTITNTYIVRSIVNNASNHDKAPDFINGTWFLNTQLNADGLPLPIFCNINVVRGGVLTDGENPYLPNNYGINLQSDRLKSKTVTRHLENGDFSQTETYEYMPGTSIITSVKTSNPADSRKDCISITYPSADRSDIERQMVDRNMIGIPVKSTHVFGNDSVSVRREMKRFDSNVFRPAKEWLSRGTYEWLAGSYDYDSYGNLRQYIGMDPVPTTYLWGYSALHPVYKIDGAGYTEVKSLNSSMGFCNGSAEKGEINLPSDGRRWLVTKALWKPFVGITSLRQPCGLTTNYDYDYAGRLIHESLEGLGPVSKYSYHINRNGLNFTTHSRYYSENNSFIQEIINYDGLGREISRLKSTPAPSATDVEVPTSCGYTAVFTEYDAMDRPFRKWTPVMLPEQHPTIDVIKSATNSYYGTEHAYETTFYEASPAGLVCGSRKAGEEWHQADRKLAIRHLVNKASGDYSCPDCYASSRYIYTDQRYYHAGALTIEEVTDEEGHISMTFTDRRGKTVMIREGVPGDWNDTRFVYNDYGDLLFVIQPESSGNVRKTECFRYEYDSRGNCTLKGIPGGAETRYRYDARKRLFAEQDGKMKNDGVWLIHHYDNLGRPAFSAYAEVSNAVIESLCAGAFTVVQGATTGDGTSNDGGYKCPAELSSKLKYTALAEAHYYDSYSFTAEFKGYWTSYSRPEGFPVPRASAAGLETATAAGNHILLKMYDGTGRVIREAYGEMDRWPERETLFRHDYNGNLLEQIDDTSSPKKIRRRTLNTYWSTGHLRNTKIIQNGDSATIKRLYDGGGRIKLLNLGAKIARAFTYNANGWLTSSLATNKPSSDLIIPDHLQLTIRPQALDGIALTPKESILTESLHYADEADGVTPRYDGKIAARRRDSRLSTYSYDNHGRLESAVCKYEYTGKPVLEAWDYSTSYSYDRNANITSLSRQGIIDNIGIRKEFGLHSRYTMKYAVNRLASMEIEREGEDYEGRTGVGATGKISNFWYDANGNLGRDLSRGILSTNYNRLDLPTDVYFINGHRQTIEYDGFGQKRRVSYSQTSDPILGSMMGVPEDSAYTLQGRRDYIGPHVFVGDSLEYSAFPGGYFTPEGVFYYITDWQGNNIAVFSDKGDLVQQTTYYPYGEPTIEPTGQRYLFGGKEREHAGGRNSYDYGPRCLGPSTNWDSADKLATETPQTSPFSYCGGDPINRVDPTGMIGYVINEYGELQELILDDELDYIDIDTSDGQYIPGDHFPKGTIENYKQYSGGFDVFTIRGDENGKKIFEWLADNTTRPDSSNPKETTGIEFSFFQTGIEGDKGLNFISTSHMLGTDNSLIYLINNQLRFNYTIRTYTHNHPSGSSNPSEADLDTIKKLDKYSGYSNFRNAQYFIYASKMYNKYDKNYKKE